ncbi:hypothetical protein BGZ93_002859 [Podila epicladia]|nr:hypothetical protein BGZ93_002859 [Podila epicladia]
MVEGEKRGYESSKRRNMGQVYSPEEIKHKKCGLDLICHDEILREVNRDTIRESITIAHNMLFKVPTGFREKCAFVRDYTGNRGVSRTGKLICRAHTAHRANTTELYNTLIGPGFADAFMTVEPESDDDSLDRYDKPEPCFGPNRAASPSPMGAEDFYVINWPPSDSEDLCEIEAV